MSFLRQHDVAKVFEFTPTAESQSAADAMIRWGSSESSHRVYLVHASVRAATVVAQHWMVGCPNLDL